MKIFAYLLSLFALSFVLGCDKEEDDEARSQEQIFCTQDVKECPDGSFVSRDPQNECAFAPCP